MSPLWKSELQIRLGRESASARVRSAWRRQVTARAEAPGLGVAALPALLEALRAQGLGDLPRHASLLVPDEQAYLALLPAETAWGQARQRALDHFAAALGRQDLLVQVSALRGGRWWLAAAIERADLDAWQRQLAEAGLVLGAVGLALLDDLAAISARVGDDGVVAVLRDEGVTLLRLAEGSPVELAWERCDPHAQSCIEQRVLAFRSAAQESAPGKVVMLCQSRAQHDAWLRLAAVHRWKLLSPQAHVSELPA